MNKMKFKNIRNTPHNINDRIIWESRHVTVVGIIILYMDSKIYVLASTRGPNAMSENGKMNLVVGFLDWNETTSEAVIRECWEETGFNVPAYMKKYKIKLNNITEPWSINSDPNRHKSQNVSFRYGVILEASSNAKLPLLSVVNNEIVGEIENPIWLPIGDIDKHIWAFNHDELIKLYMLFSEKELLKSNEL